jgi:small conductance mechanosensitive channel
LFLARIIVGIPNAFTALAIFLVSLYAAGLAAALLKKVLQKRRAAPGASRLLAQLVRWTIIVIGTITALQRFFDVTAFLAGLGILGFTVGFALQDVMKNFAAGVILLVQRPFRVGEAISVAGFDGTIQAIDLRSTEMKTFDGRIVLIPNADVITNPITNYSRSDRRRVDLVVGVSYGADLQTARRTVLGAVQEVSGFVADPPPMVVFHTFSNQSVDMTAQFWIDTAKTNPPAAKDEALTRVKTAFDREGIEIPHPHPAHLPAAVEKR